MKPQSKIRFTFLPERCTTCGSHSIKRIALQYLDFEGSTVEELKLCSDCNSVFSLDMDLTDVYFNQTQPLA